MGELVDLDDSMKEKRRLDRARVLIKTPWRPLIQHTVEVVIGEEKFTVQVVEECCSSYQDCFRRGRSVRGSSEEINSDDSFLDSSSFTNWGLGDNASLVPETEPRSARLGTVTMIVDGAENHGEQQPPHLPASESHNAPHGVVAEAVAGAEDQESPILPNGQTVSCYPLDNENNPRVDGGNRWVTTHGPNLNSLQVSATNKPEDIAKKGVMQWVRTLNTDDTLQSYHQIGNEGHGESSGLEMGQKGDNAVVGDVERAEDSFMTRGTCEYKEVEASIAGKEARVTLKDQDNSIFTPSDKRSKLGLNPLVEGDANTCQVYSRQRRCKKKPALGFIPSGSGAAAHNGLTQPQHIQLSTLQREPYNENQETSFQPQVSNGVKEATTDSDKIYNPEALQMWSMAKQLGLTGEGSKEVIIQKFQHMEERDRAEANRRETATDINENNFL